MQTLPSSLKDGTLGWQKGVAAVLLFGAIYGIAMVSNAFLPTIIEALKLWYVALFLGLPIGLGTLYCITNPLVVWGFFKTLSRKFTSWIIKLDPLSVMDRYVDYLTAKLSSLRKTVQVLSGKKVKLDRNIQDLTDKIEENARLGVAAKKEGKEQIASTYGTKVATDRGTLQLLTPLQVKLDKNLKFLEALAENWEYGIEKLKYQIEGKRAEYEIIRETHKGLKTAEDFINSDNDAARNYGESIRALEESVTQKIGFIEDFEKRSKGAMDMISIEKQALKDEGLAELEQYMKDGNLMLPDFSNVTTLTSQQVEYVPANTGEKKKKFGLGATH